MKKPNDDPARFARGISRKARMVGGRQAALAAVWLWAISLSGCDEVRFRVRTPPGQVVDVFRQAEAPTIDILWVVDNSSSMTQEQQELADHFGSFFQFISQSEADFHIGVISTDVYDPAHRGRLLGSIPIISRATPSPAEVFAANVHVGITGKGDEQGFTAASLALSEPLISNENAGFVREAASLYIIFVSDEDDHSFGEVEAYVRRFEQIKGVGNDKRVACAAVVGDVPDGCPGARAGTRYAQLAQESGGVVGSICDTDFAGVLEALGYSAAGLKRAFSLSRVALPGSVTVYVKTGCGQTAMDPAVCEKVFDDCRGSAQGIYGLTCVVRQALPDGVLFDAETSSIRFVGAALPPFGAIVEVGYTPREEP
ncbi:MAG: hypothetical protein GYA21_08620 [Myxococcales bacterium]|nr:hypothetical protein [Myxococcales bacterium]